MTSATADLAPTRSRRKTGRISRGDQVLHAVILGMVWIVLAIFAGIFGVLVSGAWPAMKRFGPGFIVGTGWDPVHLVFGAFPFVVGTVIVAASAMVLAGGVGLMTAIFVTELPPWLQEPLAYLLELLAFIPSVVYGLFGLLSVGAAVTKHRRDLANRAPWPTIQFFGSAQESDGLPERPASQRGGLWLI